jgi:hypothetical protein
MFNQMAAANIIEIPANPIEIPTMICSRRNAILT